MKGTDDEDNGVDSNNDDLDGAACEAALDVLVLPAGRDLLLESPCKVKRFRALAAEWPDWLAEASTGWGSQREQGLVQQGQRKRRKKTIRAGRRSQCLKR